jgi:hypothetical protein
LWEFGGLYIHLGLSAGPSFDTSTILDSYDGFFFIDPQTKELSTKVMAVSPRHPLMYFAIQQIIDYVLSSNDINDKFTGASALNRAFRDFGESTSYSQEQGERGFGIVTGHYVGVLDRSIHIIDYLGGDQNLLYATFHNKVATAVELEEMGAMPFDGESSTSCLEKLYENSHKLA